MNTPNQRKGRSLVLPTEFSGRRSASNIALSEYMLAIIYTKAPFLRWPLVLVLSCLTCACGKNDSVTENGRAEMTTSAIILQDDCSWAQMSEYADVYVYSDEGIRSLEFKGRFSSCDTIFITTSEGDKVIEVIAGSKDLWEEGAFSTLETAELVENFFENEDENVPLMTGSSVLKAGDLCVVTLTPLLSRIELSEVTNNQEGYRRLESPRIRLRQINSSAQIFRQEGFRPSEVIENGNERYLPCDIGMFTQESRTSLYCYPNDSFVSSIGTPHTSLEFICEIKGEQHSFITELGTIGRNENISLSLTVEDDLSFEFRVIQI